MDKLQAIEFKDGEILIYQDTPAHHNAHDLADFEADKTLGTVKRVFTLINANEAQAEIDVTYGKAFVAGKKNGEETMQDEIAELLQIIKKLEDTIQRLMSKEETKYDEIEIHDY